MTLLDLVSAVSPKETVMPSGSDELIWAERQSKPRLNHSRSKNESSKGSKISLSRMSAVPEYGVYTTPYGDSERRECAPARFLDKRFEIGSQSPWRDEGWTPRRAVCNG